MITSFVKSTTLLILTLILTTGCIIHVGGDKRHGGDKGPVSSVFGDLEVGEGKQVADVSSVNGKVVIHDHAEAGDIDSVNGSIDIGKHVTANSVEAVNGSIKIGQNFIAHGGVSTVNGDIRLLANSSVSGDITTLNGDIFLDNVNAGEDVKTRNGNITLANQSIINGNIVFEAKDDNSWGWNKDSQKIPVLVIDANSTVNGRIILKQKVSLDIKNAQLLEKVELSYQDM